MRINVPIEHFIGSVSASNADRKQPSIAYLHCFDSLEKSAYASCELCPKDNPPTFAAGCEV